MFNFDAGLNYQGILAHRDKDIFGLGFSYVRLKHGPVNDTGPETLTNHEAVLEATYQLALGEHVSLQPDLQFIFNPGAVESAATAVVAGLRLNIRF